MEKCFLDVSDSPPHPQKNSMTGVEADPSSVSPTSIIYILRRYLHRLVLSLPQSLSWYQKITLDYQSDMLNVCGIIGYVILPKRSRLRQPSIFLHVNYASLYLRELLRDKPPFPLLEKVVFIVNVGAIKCLSTNRDCSIVFFVHYVSLYAPRSRLRLECSLGSCMKINPESPPRFLMIIPTGWVFANRWR